MQSQLVFVGERWNFFKPPRFFDKLRVCVLHGQYLSIGFDQALAEDNRVIHFPNL
jgi:hypothetical protein